MPVPEIVREFIALYPEWAKHYDLNMFQQRGFAHMKANLRVHELILQQDFAEKLAIHPVREQQSDYWNQMQVTLVPIVVSVHIDSFKRGDDRYMTQQMYDNLRKDFFNNAARNGGGDVNPIIHLTLFILSDDPVQDWGFVKAYRALADTWLGEEISNFELNSTVGGCSCQDDCNQYWPETEAEQTSNSKHNRVRLLGCTCPGNGSCEEARLKLLLSDNCE